MSDNHSYDKGYAKGLKDGEQRGFERGVDATKVELDKVAYEKGRASMWEEVKNLNPILMKERLEGRASGIDAEQKRVLGIVANIIGCADAKDTFWYDSTTTLWDKLTLTFANFPEYNDWLEQDRKAKEAIAVARGQLTSQTSADVSDAPSRKKGKEESK